MNHILEIVLFVILFCLIIYLFLIFIGLYQIIEEKISESELKMNDKIIETIKLELFKFQSQNKK